MLSAGLPHGSTFRLGVSKWRKRLVFVFMTLMVASSMLVADPCGTIHYFNGDNPGDWLGCTPSANSGQKGCLS